MRALLILTALVSVPALAIDVGDTVYATSDTPSLRFPDADDAGPMVNKDTELVVLVVEADRLRVMTTQDKAFGWVPADAITEERAAPDMQELIRQLQGQMPSGGIGAGAP
ncbi:MAG: hypothetical protein AB8H79_23285 [Myxococcota bacterium]